jgi:hypothetical protein
MQPVTVHPVTFIAAVIGEDRRRRSMVFTPTVSRAMAACRRRYRGADARRHEKAMGRVDPRRCI